MKLLTIPEQIHWSETREFKVINDHEQEQMIRVIESSNGTTVFIKQDAVWQQSEDMELVTWIQNELETEELRLDFESREQAQIKLENEKNTVSDCVVIDSSEPSSDN